MAGKTVSIKHRGAVLSPNAIAVLMAEAAGWKPEEGTEIEGTVLGVRIGHNQINGSPYPIVFVLPGEDEDPVAVHGFTTVLDNELRSQRPEMGDKIYIKCLGPKKDYVPSVKGYDPPILFAVVVTKPGGAPSDPWASLGARQPATPDEEE